MAYLFRPTDAQPQEGDQTVNELYKIVDTSGTYTDHAIAVNAFLLTLRNLPDHTVYIREVDTTIASITGPVTNLYTTIRFTLVGDPVIPVL